jgi:hypothetical protein
VLADREPASDRRLVMPTIPRGNTTAPTIARDDRAANLLKD